MATEQGERFIELYMSNAILSILNMIVVTLHKKLISSFTITLMGESPIMELTKLIMIDNDLILSAP